MKASNASDAKIEAATELIKRASRKAGLPEMS
jgi:hypothetical protein